MKILPLIIFAGLLLAGCSSDKNVVKENSSDSSSKKVKKVDKDKAMEHFIDGSTAEAKGDFAAAIIEFQDALRYDEEAGIYYALAKNYYLLNKLSLALQHARKSVELEPEQVEYYFLLSEIYKSADQRDSSAAALSKIIEIDSTNVTAYYELAVLYEKNRPKQAIEIYKKLTDIIGPEWSILVRVADLYEQLGDLEHAAETTKELIALDPANVGLQKILIEYYQRLEKYDEALEVADEILMLTPDDAETKELKSQIYIAKGDWESAAKEFNYILEQPEVPLDTKIRIGANYFARSLEDSTILPVAKELFQKIDKDTTDWQVKLYLGAIAMNEGDDSTAIENFKYVTENARWNVQAWIRLGGLYFDNQKYDEASKLMNEAINNFPDNFAVNLILGLSLAQNGNHKDAKQYLYKAVQLNPNDMNALSGYGYTLSQLKENDEAVKYLKKALQISPGDVNLLGTLGLIYDSMENWELCDSTYEYALKIEPDNPLVNNNYAYSLSERDKELERALEMVKISVEAEPDNTSYLDTIGWVYYKLGDYEKAKTYLEKSIQLGGEQAVQLEHLGDVLFKTGEQQEAKKLWEKALSLDQNNESLKSKVEKGEI